MKDLGYGKGYAYAHDEAEGVAGMECLPEGLVGRRDYEPTNRCADADLAARLDPDRLIRQWMKTQGAGSGRPNIGRRGRERRHSTNLRTSSRPGYSMPIS